MYQHLLNERGLDAGCCILDPWFYIPAPDAIILNPRCRIPGSGAPQPHSTLSPAASIAWISGLLVVTHLPRLE